GAGSSNARRTPATQSEWKSMKTDLSEGGIRPGVGQTSTRWDLELHTVRSPVLRYTFAVICVAIAFGLAFAFQYFQFRDVEVPVFPMPIAVVTWYAGNGPSALSILLCLTLFDYFFVEPLYSFEISAKELPYVFIFVAWGVIVASFAAVRRWIEENLRQAHEEL